MGPVKQESAGLRFPVALSTAAWHLHRKLIRHADRLSIFGVDVFTQAAAADLTKLFKPTWVTLMTHGESISAFDPVEKKKPWLAELHGRDAPRHTAFWPVRQCGPAVAKFPAVA